MNPASDYNGGCHSDQLLGQWWADQLGLGNIFPEYRLKSAYNSIFRYNYRPSLKNHVQSPREFARKDDPGIIVATWPYGDRPGNSTAYSDEVWTTHEYTVSSGLIKYHNLIDAFTLLRSGVSRYDGVLKSGYKGEWGNFGFSGNPFGDDECGQFYSRALSCWSVLLALQGFGYDGPKGYLSFEPVWQPHDHCSFFSTSEGWGNFYQQIDGEKQSNRILLFDGYLNLKNLRLDNLSGNRNLDVKVFYDGKQINPELEIGTDKIDLRFDGLKLEENKELKIDIYDKK